MIYAIDPGTKATGWAAFAGPDHKFIEYGRLMDCGLVRAPKGIGQMIWELNGLFLRQQDRPERAVIEKPVVYDQKSWKGDPNDLVSVALISGAAGALLEAEMTEFISPRTWKGGVPKDISNRRIIKKLDDCEAKLLQNLGLSKTMRHNVVDAIGIGLWAVNR